MIKFIKARNKDFKKVDELLIQFRNSQVPFAPHRDKIDSEHMSFEEYKKEKNANYLLLDKNKVIGLILIVIENTKTKKTKKEKTLFVHRVIIDKKYRGKGYGTHLLEFAKNLKEKKADKAIIGVNIKNKVAFNLYKKTGFKPKCIMMDFLKDKKNVNTKGLKIYKVIKAKESDFDQVRDIMKTKDNILINFFNKIANDDERLITKKEFNKYLKNNLLFTIKSKNKIIGVMGATITHVEYRGQITRDMIEIDFLFVDKSRLKKDEDKGIMLSFFNKIKEIKNRKNLAEINTHFDLKQKEYIKFYKSLGFFPVMYDLEMK